PSLGFVFTVQWFRLGGCVAHTLMRRYASGEKMEDILTILKVCSAVVAIIATLIGVLKFKFTRRSAMIAEYQHARAFLSEVDTLHPYAKDLGFYTIAGSSYVSSAEIEYAISLENPVKSLKCYVKGRKYFIPFNELKYPKLKFKPKYESQRKRVFLTYFYMVMYFLMAFVAMSPAILSQFIDYSSLTDYVSLLLVSLVAFGYLAYEMLQRHLEIYFAQFLFDSQEVHRDLKVVKA
ncbi:hypothetical protein ACEWBX_09750, partial [Vibrio parahaemolyticus]